MKAGAGRAGSFLPGILAAVFLTAFGGFLAWAVRQGERDTAARASWTWTDGELREVGIYYGWGRRYWSYRLTARFAFDAGGRQYEGKSLAGRISSTSLASVASLADPYVPEALALTEKDFGFLRGWKTWTVTPPARVRVRYDPAEPSRNQAILARSLPPSPDSRAGSRIIPIALVAAGAATVLLLALAARPEREKVRTPEGPPLSSPVYREEDRQALQEAVARLSAEADRVGDLHRPRSSEQESFLEAVEDLSRRVRDGTLVPRESARHGYGRWADEIFGDDPICSAALAVQSILSRLSRDG